MKRDFYFHLAIPSRDIEESVRFYKELGCEVGRVNETSAIFNFFDMQLVVHKCDALHRDFTDITSMYPRHYGLVLDTDGDYRPLQMMWDKYKAGPGVFKELFTRNEGKFTEHKSFFLKDPSNNLIEVKTYKNYEAIFTPRTI